MQIFDSENNATFPNLRPDAPVLSLFAYKTGNIREIMPWMDMATIVDIVTDRMIEVVKKDLNMQVEPKKAEMKPPKSRKKLKK
ncbi:MAG: hypothetical protein IPH12_18045 [Saprospirales bacterium]|nr:hypothetical protein [Saprospirales bacterium]